MRMEEEEKVLELSITEGGRDDENEAVVSNRECEELDVRCGALHCQEELASFGIFFRIGGRKFLRMELVLLERRTSFRPSACRKVE